MSLIRAHRAHGAGVFSFAVAADFRGEGMSAPAIAGHDAPPDSRACGGTRTSEVRKRRGSLAKFIAQFSRLLCYHVLAVYFLGLRPNRPEECIRLFRPFLLAVPAAIVAVGAAQVSVRIQNWHSALRCPGKRSSCPLRSRQVPPSLNAYRE